MNNMTRREALKAVVGAGAFVTTCGASAVAEGAKGGFPEPGRVLPLVEDADLIVAGGGPAGIAAAVTAARMGKRVRLFEAHGALGGLWTVGMISCIIDFGRGDLTREITKRLDAYGGRHRRWPKLRDDYFVYEPESMKLVLEDICTEAGVKFTYHTSVVAAYRDAAGKNIETVVTESKGGRRAWRAPLFMDCTGDGDLAALAGCGFDLGGGNGNGDQPATLVALVCLENDEAVAKFSVNHPGPEHAFAGNAKGVLYRELVAAGIEPTYASPTLFRLHRGLYAFVANQEYGVKLDDADGITTATVRARKELSDLVTALVRHDPETWKGLRLVATADQLGHRAARRIHGRYTLTIDDLMEGRQFPDAVSSCAFQLDVHGVSRKDNRIPGAHSAGRKIKVPYQIPLGSCRAKDLDNLYMAGRCISGDFLSQSSYRVTGPAVEMAEGVVRRVFAR